MSVRLGSPWWLLLLALVIVRVVMVIRDRRAAEGAFSFSALSLVAARRTLRTLLADIPFVLEILALTLIIVAMARPQRVTRVASSDRFGVDMMIAIDSSGSMAAEDFRPRNRFHVAKELIADFIERRQDDRIGVITFGTRAATRAPITFDREIAARMLQNAQIGENGDGTAIGQAIATSVNRLKSSKTTSRVIILVTDGVNNSGAVSPSVASFIASQHGIKIYTIGVGSQGAVPLPVKRQNRFTGEIETVYTTVRGQLDEKGLTEIARATGGEFFRATDARALGDVLSRIDTLEKSRLTAPKSEKIEELYVWPLTAGLLLLVLALLLGETVLLKVTA